MKIAEVWVNPKSLPTKEVLISQALKSKKYYQIPIKKALTLINEEIKESGLFKSTVKRVTKTKEPNTKSDSRRSNNKQRKHNQSSKE